jgi:hypothetical protein
VTHYTLRDPRMTVVCGPCRYMRDHQCLGTVRVAVIPDEGMRTYRCDCTGCRAKAA